MHYTPERKKKKKIHNIPLTSCNLGTKSCIFGQKNLAMYKNFFLLLKFCHNNEKNVYPMAGLHYILLLRVHSKVLFFVVKNVHRKAIF